MTASTEDIKNLNRVMQLCYEMLGMTEKTINIDGLRLT